MTIIDKWHTDGERIVLTNGVFDLIHAGHVLLLETAARLGTKLVVALNTDASVRRLKGHGRPLMPEGRRGLVVGALRAVDHVVFFAEDTPLRIIKDVRPHILVKGADWAEEDIVGATEVRSWGGYVKRVPIMPEASTSLLLDRIREMPE